MLHVVCCRGCILNHDHPGICDATQTSWTGTLLLCLHFPKHFQHFCHWFSQCLANFIVTPLIEAFPFPHFSTLHPLHYPLERITSCSLQVVEQFHQVFVLDMYKQAAGCSLCATILLYLLLPQKHFSLAACIISIQGHLFHCPCFTDMG